MAVDKNAIMVKALKFVQKSDFERALKELAPAIKAYPKDTNLLSKQGEWLAKLQKRKEAAEVFQKVADIFTGQGFLKKSLAVYRQMTFLVPDDISVHEKLADLYQQLGYMSEAKSEYETIANYYERKGEIQKALNTLQQMVDLDPDNLLSRMKLADQYAREQIFTKASSELEKVATALKEQNRAQEYLKVAERLYKYQPDNRDLALEIAQIYHAQGDLQGALNMLHGLYKADPKHIPTLELLAQVFSDINQKQKSLAIWMELARIYQDKDDDDNRKRCYKHALNIDPTNEAARSALGIAVEKAAAPKQPQPAREPPKPTPAPPPAAAREPSLPPAAPHKPAAPAPKAAPPAPAPQPKPIKKVSPKIEKMLTEVDVYVKYGLLDQAFEHLANILKEEPENLVAHATRVKIARDSKRVEVLVLALAEYGRVLLIMGKEAEAQEVTQELQKLSPNDKRLAILKSGGTEFPEMTEEEIILIETGEFKSVVSQPEIDAPMTLPDAKKVPEVKSDQVKPKARPKSAEEEIMTISEEELLELTEGVSGDLDDEEVIDLDGEEVMDISSEEADGILGIEPAEDDEQAVVLEESETETYTDEYEEAEFFVEQGLIDEAKEIYKAILKKSPKHAETLQRLSALESGQIEEEIQVFEDRPISDSSPIFDIGDEIEQAIQSSGPKDRGTSAPDVFNRVRSAVIPPPEEAENHINLGIAYREMGLFKEAEDEFLQAVAHPDFTIQAYELIGRCRLDLKDYDGAVAQFKKALSAREMAPDEAVAIYYELGEAYRGLGDKKQANYYYRLVHEVQPEYREVDKRIRETGGLDEIDVSDWSNDGILSDAEASLDEDFGDLFDDDENS